MKKKKGKLKISILIATILLFFLMILSCSLRCKATFELDNNSIYKTIVVNKGETIDEPDHPEKEGHTFCGWYTEGKKYDFNKPIKESVKLVSSWCVNEYEVTIKTGTGSIINDKIKYNEKLTLPSNLTKPGYNFLGWFANGDKVDENTKVTSDMTIEGIWAKKDYAIYTVEHYFMDREGNYPKTASEKEVFTAKTDSVVTPSVKTKKGYTSPEIGSIKVSYDGKSTIKYYYSINSYNLTVEGDKGISATTGDGTYFYGDKVEILYTLKPGYSFDSYSETIEDNFYTVGEEDVVIYITTKVNNDTKYTVEHYQMNLSGKYSDEPTNVDVLEGTTDTKVTPKVDEYEGFTSPESQEVIINGDGSTVVKYYYERNKYDLHIVASTGIEKAYGNGRYYYGDKVTVKVDVKKGYTFDKWSNGNTELSFEHTIGAQNKAMIAKAKVNVYSITYKLNNGVATNPTSYTVEDEIQLSIPEKLGYTFVKWEGNNVTSDGKINKGTTGDIIVEAMWEVVNYKIQYNLNGATLANKPNTYTIEDEIQLSIPEKLGYTFVKWEGNNVTNDGKIAKGTTGDITVEAILKANNYTVVFDKNGATSGVMSSQSFTYDEYKVLIENNYVKTGYTFIEWNTNKDGSGIGYLNEEEVNNLATSGTVTLYAQWIANTYTIEYNSNLGTGTMPIQLTKYDLSTTLYENTFERAGYTFNGWNTKNDGTGTSYFDKENVINLVTDAKITLYAQWKANTYTIEFDANTGIGTVDPQVFTYDVAQNINANTFNKTGYTFKEWNTKADGTGISYENQEEVINLLTSGSITLYAQWTVNNYTVTFDANGGTGTMNDQTFTYNVEQSLSSNAFTKTGYTFNGWNTSSDGKGISYANNEIVSNLVSDGTITLYAEWKANTYRVEFDSMGGTGTMDPQWFVYDRSASLDANGFVKKGYTFSGWNTKADGTGTSYANQEEVSNLATSGRVTLYAMWTANTYTVAFDANTGIGSMNAQTFTYDVTQKLTLNTFTKTGYTFAGWNTAQDGNGTSYTNEEEVSNLATNGNVTLYAQWKANSYKIEYNPNLGTGTMPIQLTKYDLATNLYKNEFTKLGYTFVEWNTKADGTGISYENQESVSNLVTSGTVTLYAQWVKNIYTVEFNANGGSGSMSSQTHTYDEDKTLSENEFTKLGYTFAGWNTKVDGSGTSYEDQEEVSNLATSGRVTLYAQWIQNTYTVVFNSNTGTGTMEDQTFTYDVAQNLSSNTFTKTGYTFAGWNTASDGSGTSYTDKESVSNLSTSGTVTLYAMWVKNTYTVVFNSNTGTGTMNSQTHTYDEDKTLSENEFTKLGYTFAGWNTASDGSGANYANKASVSNLSTSGSVTLYAMWNINIYTIEYNLNGGTVTTENPINYTVENEITLNTPTKPGYTFVRWEGTGVNNGKILRGTTGNITATAIWSVNNYNVIFNANSGIGTNVTQTFTYGVAQNLSENTFTKPGYTFVEWNTEQDGSGASYANKASVSNLATSGNITLYAQWTANTYTVEFNSNTGTGSMSLQTHTYDEDKTLSENEFTKLGYTFSGWNTKANGSGTSYEDQEEVNNLATSGSVTLYAQWTPNTYTVEFNANGGTGIMPTQMTAYDKETILYANTFERVGYTFAGWNTASDGSGTSYADKESVSNLATSGTATLYAKWVKNTYTVVFNSNTGTGTMNSQTHTYDEDKTLSENEFTKLGYTFAGWNTASDGSGANYANKASVSNLSTSGSVTLYAMWNINTYTIEYNLNGGTVTTENTINYTVENEITLNTPTKPGYTFVRWEGTGVNNGKILRGTTGNITATAIWSVNNYNVIFNANSGIGTNVTQTFTYGVAQNLSENTFTKPGYKFVEWNTESDGTGTSYENQESVSNLATSGNVTLYAQWTANTYTVEFNSNTGTGTMNSQTHTYDEDKTLSENEFTKLGYTFSGWNTKADGSGTSYEDQEEVNNLATSGSVTLYAKWTPNTYTVEFNANGGTGTMPTQMTAYDNETTLYENTFERVGYTFAGWNTAQDGSGTSYADKESVSNLATSGTATLYAKWIPTTYTIEYNLNGGTVSTVNPTKYTILDEIILNAPTKTGYTFIGWTGIGVSTDGTIAVGTTENITATAMWEVDTYTIEYNLNGGTVTTANPTSYTILDEITLNVPTKSGYVFTGWTGTGVSTDGKITIGTTGNITVTANYELDRFKIIFDTNGGSDVADFVTYYGYPITKPNNPSKIGHDFVGWYIDSRFTTEFDFTQTMPYNDLTLYAKWDANDSIIGFISNGGTAVESIVQDYGTPVVEPEEPTKQGYDFVGWYSDIKLTTPYVFTTMPLEGIVLYAKWEANLYDIAYHANGGTGIMPTQKTAYDNETTLYENTFERVGYTFAGWNTAQDGSGTSYADKASVSNLATSGSVTLYAKWIPTVYTIEYNLNGGTVTTANPTKYTILDEITLNAPTKTGYTFIRWTGIGVSTDGTIAVGTTGNITATAVYKANTYTVVFNENGGTGSMNSQTHTYDASQNLTSNAFTKDGYTFSGWNTAQNGSGTNYANGASISNLATSGSVTLYAQWTQNTYTVVFNANGGSGSMSSQTHTYDATKALIKNEFTKTGYTFAGWNTAQDGSGTSYVDKESVSNLATSGSVILYAKWTANTYTVNFDANTNNVTGTMENQLFTFDVSQNLSENTFTKPGYTFSGWNTKTDGTGTNYVDQEEVSNIATSESVTLYAIWTQNTYTVVFNPNGGTGSMDNQTHTYDATKALSENKFERTGYTFAGWNTVQNGTGTNYANQEEVSNLASSGTVTLYAKWITTVYTLEYNLNGGTVATANPTSYTILDEITLNAPSKPGYTFFGWTGTGVSSNGVIAEGTTGNITATAVYTANTYTVEFNANGGTGSMNSQIHTYDATKALSANEFTKEGYTFSGWNTAQDGSGTNYANKESVSNLATSGSVTLYATWTQNTYTVEFNANGGIGSMNSQTHTYDAAKALSKNVFTKEGYTFSGWNTAQDGSGTSYADKASVSNLATSGSVILYAKWTANTYTVTFVPNTNNVTGTMENQSFTYGVSQNLSENAFNKPGYTFSGWNTAQDGSGTSYADKASVSNLATSGSVILYAKWTPNTYTVVFDENGGAGTMNSQTHTYDASQNLTSNAFSKEGYTFSGWNTAQNGSGTNYANQASVSNIATSGSVTLYAQWTPNTYTVVFNANGGAGTMNSQTHTYDASQNLTSNAFSKEGYTFSRWNTAQDGSGTNYANQASVSNLATSGSVTLYAQWTPNTYTVNFDSNGGSGSMNSQTHTYDATKTLSENKFERTGYTFFGWNTAQDGSGTNYANQASVSNLASSGSVTLYAIWTQNTYTVVFNPNGGTGSMDNQTHTYDATKALSENKFKQTGYTFAGWNTAQDGTGTNYANQEEVSNLASSGTVTLYAKWITTVYTIEYNLNGGTVATANPTSYTILEEITLNAPTKSGYTFTRWTGTGVSSNGVIAEGTTGNITATAVYIPNTYTVVFNANGGSGAMNSQTHTYDATKALSANEFTKLGYTFAGWNTAQDGSGTNYANGVNVSNLATSGSVTLYAQWTPNTYTVEFDANGGSGSMSSQTHTYDATKALSANEFTKLGYTFAGWNTAQNGTGTNYANGASVSNLATSGSVTLYAKWTPNTYTVVFNSNTNNATGTMDAQSFTYGVSQNLNKNNFVKPGYTFAGWNTEQDESGNDYDDEELVRNLKPNGTLTLYAKWIPNTYTVTFNPNGGTGSIYTQNFTYDVSQNLSPNQFNKANYEFAGWNTKVDGTGTTYANGVNVINLATSGNITLYAKWKATTYTVTFNANGGTGSMDNQTHTYDATKALSENKFGRVGYTFSGWNTAIDGSGTNYADQEEISNITSNASITLYAKWTANRYDIIYNPNGGTGIMPDQITAYDNETTLYNNTFEKTGYTFTEWNTSQDGSGTSYVNQASVNNLATSGTITLYAQWTKTTYTITYNLNGGTVTTANPTSYTILDEITLNAPSKTGYTFTGWTGIGVSTDGKIAVGTTGNITATAVYTPNTYTITFDANGGTGSMNSQTHTYDVSQNLTSNAFTRVGYTFSGWNTAQDGTGTNYANGASVSNLATSGNVTLYAKWTPIKYSITYNLNGGTDTGNPKTYTIEDEITLKEPNKKDYGIIKWIINGNDSNGVIPQGTTGNLSIEAVYGLRPKIESLSFDVYKDKDATTPYYSDGVNHSVYEGKASFYLKLPRDAYIDIYSIGFTTNIGIYLNPSSDDIAGDKFYDISATNGGKGSTTGKIDFNLDLGLAVDIPTIDIAATNSEATAWRSSKEGKYLQEVKFFFQVLSSNNLALADALAKSNEDVPSLRYLSYRQDVQNNTFIFFAPINAPRKSINFVTSIEHIKNDIKLTTIKDIPIDSTMPDMDEYQLAGFEFKGWFLDKELTIPYDPNAYVEDVIAEYGNTVYGWYEELEGYDTKWYYSDTTKKSYDICGKEQLKGLAAISGIDPAFAGKTVNLTCDVNLDGEEWIPIVGTYTDSNNIKYYQGTFNGNNHTIKNFKVTTYKDSQLGFFGAIRNSTIKNVIFDGVTISSTTSSGAAAVAGVADNSHAYRVWVKNANVTGQTQTAGIFGRFKGGSIKESKVTSSNITSSGTDTGSAGASLSDTITIQDFYSNATVVSNASAAPDTGGIIGSYTYDTNALTMKNLLFTGTYSAPKASIFFNTSGEIYGRIGASGITGGQYDSYSGSMDKTTWLYDKTILPGSWLRTPKGTGKSTSDLKKTSTYSESVWFRNIWVIDGVNYPELKWIANLRSVTLNVNGGDALTSNIKKVILGEAYGTLPTPTRSGYTFSGWYTAVDGGTQVTSETIATSEITTLYARWTQI